VAAVSENETEVVSAFREGGGNVKVGAEPVELGGIPVEIPSRCLEKYPQRFLRRVLDQLGVAVAASELGGAAEEAEDSPEPIMPRPSDSATLAFGCPVLKTPVPDNGTAGIEGCLTLW
jgi:hypothetical protein